MNTFDAMAAEVVAKSNPHGYNQYTGAGGVHQHQSMAGKHEAVARTMTSKAGSEPAQSLKDTYTRAASLHLEAAAAHRAAASSTGRKGGLDAGAQKKAIRATDRANAEFSNHAVYPGWG